MGVLVYYSLWLNEIIQQRSFSC